MKQVFRVEPLEGWGQLKELVYETIALIELHLPEVDTVSVLGKPPKSSIARAKERWDMHLPYSLMKNIGVSIHRAN